MGRRLTVLVALKGLGIGGAERLVSESARLWDREAFDYHVAYVLPWKDQLVGDLRAADVPVHLIGGVRGATPGTAWRLRSLVRSLGASLIHAHLPSMGVAARLASPAPVVYTEHNVVGSYRPITRVANRLTYHRNRVVIAVSQAVADSVNGYPGPRPLVIPNGVKTPVDLDSSGVRAELGLREDQPLVVHVGNIRPRKGHENLVRAAALLHRTHPEAVIVSLGGEKYPGGLQRLRVSARQEGLEGTMRFLGQRPDAVAFTAAADVFVNPSEVEGLPVAILEAMAVGTPVVATAVGGVPSVVHDRESGILVAPDDPGGLAAALGELLTDRGLAARMANHARKLVQSAHGLENMVRAVEDVYREVVGA